MIVPILLVLVIIGIAVGSLAVVIRVSDVENIKQEKDAAFLRDYKKWASMTCENIIKADQYKTLF